MPNPNERYLYDAAAFLDRNIPTRNDLISLDNRLFDSERPMGPESESYESRLRRLMQSLPLQDSPSGKSLEIPADLRPPIMQTTAEGRGAYQMVSPPSQGSRQPQPESPSAPIDDLDSFLKNLQAGGAMPPRTADAAPQSAGYAAAAVPAPLETQVQNINAQTMQAATGKQQEVETMSDLGKMVQAYFGGRTKEQKQKEAFMNIAAGLASGQSPRFMDNLGGAVAGAINFQRDDTNRREKEALDFGIKNQNLDDDRYYQRGQLGLGAEGQAINREELGIRREANDISRIRATREGAAVDYRQKALLKQAGDLSKNISKLQAEGGDAGVIGMMQLQYNDVMAQLGSAGIGAIPSAPVAAAPSADIVYEKVGKGFKKVGEK
jgi:hypothetical protein